MGAAFVVCLGAVAQFLFATECDADNAAFALAPRDASIAIDARGASDVLGVGGAAMRPVLESLAGTQALATFDLLARRSNAQTDVAVREVFAGRVVFYLTDSKADINAGEAEWLFGVQADDARCERVLKMLDARMVAPQRFVSTVQRLVFRRAGGWLLVAPASRGEAALEAAAKRAMAEDAANSLLGEPLIQEFLADDAPVRVFVRHDAPIGGATLVGLTRVDNALRAEVRAGTGNVLHQRRRLPCRAEPLGRDAPDYVGCAARRERHDELDRLARRPALLREAWRRRARC